MESEPNVFTWKVFYCPHLSSQQSHLLIVVYKGLDKHVDVELLLTECVRRPLGNDFNEWLQSSI